MPQHSCIWVDSKLSPKILEACRVAREAGYEHLWVDSCCIDKASSSELSEAINSMYQWYGLSTVCYAYLADVPPGKDPSEEGSAFRESRWFKRGWTLQELIAPESVIFLASDWTPIGSKLDLVDLVEEITGIPDEALVHWTSLDAFSVAQRLSWAASRETTRVEDSAYSLLGIFDITMPTLYGEGDRAFRKLQEEILRRVPDQSIFAWGHVYQGLDLSEQQATRETEYSLHYWEWGTKPLFAPNLDYYGGGSRDITPVSNDVLDRFQLSSIATTEYTPTPHGIRTQMAILSPLSEYFSHVPIEDEDTTWCLAILACEHKSNPGYLLGRVCYMPSSTSDVVFLHPGYVEVSQAPTRGIHLDLFPLSLASIHRCREHIQHKTVYISHPERASMHSGRALSQSHETINLVL